MKYAALVIHLEWDEPKYAIGPFDSEEEADKFTDRYGYVIELKEPEKGGEI